MHILLAEDDTNISTISKLSLENFGNHTVDLAHNGEEAVTMALAGNYDLILLDEMMPHKNGLTVCKEIQMNKPQAPPIIFMSAKSQKSDLEAFDQAGLGHIEKPFEPAELCNHIHHIMRAKAS